jgi:hypothetical protein
MPEHIYATDGADFESLRSLGFTEYEAMQLVHMKNHVTEHIEYRELLTESRRLGFIRWLVEHDRINES